MNKRSGGFTLIEILVALAVFAILATLTSSILFHSFDTKTRLQEKTERLNAIQLALSLIERDTAQIALRPIRHRDMQLIPALVGEPQYMEFTRGGFSNPNSEEKRSNLKRVAYLCQKTRLLRRTWRALDAANRDDYDDKVLLNGLTNCHFAYLNQSLHVLPNWQEEIRQDNQQPAPFPKAIQFNFTVKHLGNMVFLSLIPEAVYA